MGAIAGTEAVGTGCQAGERGSGGLRWGGEGRQAGGAASGSGNLHIAVFVDWVKM